MPRLAILPHFTGTDHGDGGIRRVVEAQLRHLPQFGWDITHDPSDADIVATHAGVQAHVDATIPLVNHCHGLYWDGYAWERWALRMNRDVIKAMRRADVVTAPSEFVARAIRRGSQIDPVVLPHGIDLDDWSPDKPRGYVLWNKTRIDPICDPRPVHELAQRRPDVPFVTTLDWSLYERPTNLHVTGVLPPDRAKDLVRSASVYLATTRETFGIGTLEAMACGVPVLGFDWGANAEVVQHLTTGYLAKPGDYDDLAEGLDWCLANRAEAGFHAIGAVSTFFTWHEAMARYDQLYRSLLAAPAEPHATLSIIMPCHNMEAYIADAIDSVRQQDYDDWELVVVDDASTDASMDVVERYRRADPRIRVVTNATNEYLAESLNVGVRASFGRYVMPLDPDNMLGRGALDLLVAALEQDREIDIAYGAMSVIEADEGDREWTSSWPGQFDFRRQLIHQNQIPSTSMYRRKIWDRVGGYRRRCRTAEDADFWCRATSFGANARRITDAVTLRYRNRSESMSHKVEDWPWHEWYPWHRQLELTPWIAPVSEAENFDPSVPPYEEPLISVIIPVGPGHERFVLDALDSLGAQTFRGWEAIVVNDTGAPLPWTPPWAIVTDTKGPVGAGVARNRGMGGARGRLFTFLDADDYFQPRALELMLEVWSRAGGFVYTDWFKQESGEVYHAPEWDGCDSVLRQLPWPVTCLYPRQAWDDAGGFDEALTAWEDWDFAIRVVRAGYCGTRLAVPLFHYRIHSGSRRETGFADRENLKQEILNRWQPYITGETKMPCGCGGGGGLPSLPALDLRVTMNTGQIMLPPAIEGVNPDDMVLVEFTDEVPAPLTYSGKITGTRYRFGSDDDNRVRYVYRQDAEALLTLGTFRVYNGVDGEALLHAAGPPR